MRESSEVSGAQAVAAVVGVVVLAHAVPLIGLLMMPVLAIGAAGRALKRAAGSAAAPR